MRTRANSFLFVGCVWLSGGCVPASVPTGTLDDDREHLPAPSSTAAEERGKGIRDCPAVRELYFTVAPHYHAVRLSSSCISTFRIVLGADALVEVQAPRASLAVNLGAEDEPSWLSTKRWLPGEHTLRVTLIDAETLTLHIENHGEISEPIRAERSLVWTSPALLDDNAELGLGRILGNIATDGHGAELFSDWLIRFSTTAHSERAGPAILMEELASQYGSQATAWHLNDLPFIPTAVHGRIDLRNEQNCGQLRIRFASTHPVWRPFHLLFIFDQSPLPMMSPREDGFIVTEPLVAGRHYPHLRTRRFYFLLAHGSWMGSGVNDSCWPRAKS